MNAWWTVAFMLWAFALGGCLGALWTLHTVARSAREIIDDALTGWTETLDALEEANDALADWREAIDLLERRP